MAESKSASVVFTNSSLLAKNAQASAYSAKSAADNAYNLANNAQKTADGKNRVYRGLNPNTVPTADLKAGDLYFTDNALYTWTGSTWEKTVSDTTGEEIHAKVEKAMAENDKAIAKLDADIKAKVAEIDKEIEDNKIQTGNALNFYKEQYYLSDSYTELTGGNWSDEVPTKTPGKYVWSRYVTANVGNPTNQQYSDPVCISGLDGKDGAPGPQGPQGPQGVSSYTHIAYANSADGRLGFDVGNGEGKTYIGVYVDSNPTDSTDPAKYTWTLIKGERGDQGIPGPKGADGRTPYFHVAYANSSDGTIGFDVSNSDGKIYIGQYTDYTQADSTNPASYKWTKIKGETGATGPQGPKGEPGQTGFFIGTTPPPNPAVGTVWATNDASGNMVSAKKWNGSNWVSTAFTQDLVAGNISASKIVGGELDVNKVTVKNAQNIPITSTVSLGDKLSNIEQTADGLNAYVKGSKGSDTLKAILSMDPNNSSIAQVVNGQIAAAIGTYSDGSVRIDGKVLYINSHAKIDDATIKSAMIDSIEADKITTGTLDASQIKVINLDANSITTGSLSAVVNDLRKFETYTVSASQPWDFDYTKFSYGNWFLVGEITADHVYNGPSYPNGQKLTPYMYVTSRGPEDCSSITVTVWKDNDPTQYQRVWDSHSGRWSAWVMLPNSQNIVSAINLSPDSVKISGKNIELDGNTRIADGFTLSADKIRAGTLNGMTITGSKLIANTDNGNLFGTLWKNYQVVVDNTEVKIHGTDSSSNDWESILTSDSLYLQMANDNNTWTKSIDISIVGQNPHINLVNSGPNPGQYSSTYIGSDGVQASSGQLGNWKMQGSKVLAQSGSLYVTNPAGGNFDGNGSVGFQVWAGIGLGKSTIYTPDGDLYIQQGNVGPALGQRYSDAGKVDVHCNSVISQRANTVSSRLSVKTDITPVTYDRALAAVMGTDMYDYRYTSDESGQHYVSGIIDDVNPDPQYHMDDMLINKERTARIDANLIGYHHVVLQELLKKIDELEIKLKSLESKEK